MTGSGARLPFGGQVIIGMAAGIALGFVARSLGDGATPGALGETLRIVGEMFVQLLKMLVPPLVFTAIVASIAALRTLDNAARLVTGTLLWFAITALIAVTIGITLGLIVQPGLHAGADTLAASRPHTTGSWLDFLRGLVPANILGLNATTTLTDGVPKTALSFNILQVIVVAIAIGVAAVRIGDAGAPLLALNASARSEERRVGKECSKQCRSRWSPYH